MCKFLLKTQKWYFFFWKYNITVNIGRLEKSIWYKITQWFLTELSGFFGKWIIKKAIFTRQWQNHFVYIYYMQCYQKFDIQRRNYYDRQERFICYIANIYNYLWHIFITMYSNFYVCLSIHLWVLPRVQRLAQLSAGEL